jgi:PUA domain protein
MKKVSLRKSEIKELNEKTLAFGMEFSKNDKVELVDDSVYYVNDRISFFRVNEKIIPSLKLVLDGKISLKNILVDMGAVKFIVSGADIMRPGIVSIEENIAKGDIICIVDEKNKKPLAVGEALFDIITMNSMTSGKVVKNLHYVGDKYWNFH